EGPRAGAVDPTLSARLGRFRILGRLGAGAFGAVYRAHDPQLDREVALKVPLTATVEDPRRAERFLREARAAAGLNHPHIVPVFEAGREAESYYIASAFIDGQTLGRALDRGALGLRQKVQIAHDLAEALAHAHAQGLSTATSSPGTSCWMKKAGPC